MPKEAKMYAKVYISFNKDNYNLQNLIGDIRNQNGQ